MQQIECIEIARATVAETFPESVGSMLVGSIARGETKPHSDIDLIVLEKSLRKPFRETFFGGGKQIEVFVHTFETLIHALHQDVLIRKACHISMCCDALVLHDEGETCRALKKIAKQLHKRGPCPLSLDEMALIRHEVVNLMEDLQDSTDSFEQFVIVDNLVERCMEYHSCIFRHWNGFGRWKIRELRAFNPIAAETLLNAVETFFAAGDSKPLLQFAKWLFAKDPQYIAAKVPEIGSLAKTG
ncbi:MAG TPA: nucleotidyltransferase domain-containing protein [Fimbriimonadaceae bacterium]